MADTGTAYPYRVALFQRLLIESQAACNRSCWFCPRTYDRTGKYISDSGRPVRTGMPTDKILSLLDEARVLGFRGPVSFHHYSEPLLDPRNTALAREARRRGMRPHLYTNGDVLIRNAVTCQQVNEVYDEVVVGLYDHQSEADLALLKETWLRRFDGPVISFSAIGTSSKGPAVSGLAVPRAMTPPDPRFRQRTPSDGARACNRPLLRMIIQYDGTVANCCEDTHGAFDLGNVYERSMEALWFSHRHTEIITDLLAGRRQQYALCRRCPRGPTAAAPNEEP